MRQIDRLATRKQSYDRHATNLDDVNSYLPLTRLVEAVASGVIGSIAPRFQVLYSQYSQRKTTTVDAPEVLRQTDNEVHLRFGRGNPKETLELSIEPFSALIL